MEPSDASHKTDVCTCCSYEGNGHLLVLTANVTTEKVMNMFEVL